MSALHPARDQKNPHSMKKPCIVARQSIQALSLWYLPHVRVRTVWLDSLDTFLDRSGFPGACLVIQTNPILFQERI
jgi:hypothetical protein